MSDIHKFTFGQMPTRKANFYGQVYRRLEIGEMIHHCDIWENKISGDVGRWYDAEVPYNPISTHKDLIIWTQELGR